MQSKPERLFSNRTLAILIICCLGLIIYSNTFNSSFHFDDDFAIVKNPSIKNLSNLRAIFNFWPPRFITYLSFAVNYHFSRLNVFSYHLINILIHLGSSIIVWLFTLAIFSTPVMRKQEAAGHKYMISFFAGIIFLVHPIQTQAVTYIVQRTVSLATLFYMISLYLYIKSRVFKPQTGKSDTGRFYYFSSLVTAIMAMFTKEITITLPLMIILIEYCFFKEEKKLPWRKIIPFLGMLLIIPLTLLIAKSVNLEINNKLLDYKTVIPPLNYLLTEFKVMLTYIRLLFLPLNQNLDYDYPVAKSLLELPVLSSLLFIIIVLIIAIRGFSKYRVISFSIFWFFLALMPESSIMPLQDVIFEHRLYLSMAGFSIFIVYLLYYLIGRKNIFTMLLILSVLTQFYAALAHARNFTWRDDIILCIDTVNKSPGKARVYNNLGNAYAARGMYDQALAWITKAIKAAPDFSDAYYNLGVIFYKKNDFNQALFYFNKTIKINPNDIGAYLMLIDIYGRMNQEKELFLLYRKAISDNSYFAEFYVGLAVLYGNAGNPEEVIKLCKQAIKIKPDLAGAYVNLCGAYGTTGDFKQAIVSGLKAIGFDSNSGLAHINLSGAYYYTKQYDLAIIHCDEAIRLQYNVNPDFLEALKPHRK